MHAIHSDNAAALPASTRAAASAPAFAGIATVVFLGVTAGVQMSDRGLQSILSPAIKETFGVADAVLGALHGVAGILVASALAVPLARLADRYSRKTILLGIVALWTVLTCVGALSPSFPIFFVGRAAAGITEFAMIPIVYSLIPDLVTERQRVPANLGFAALMAIGASAGFYFGGHLLAFAADVAPAGLAPWRMALLILSGAGLPLLIVGLFVHDPPRSSASAEGARDAPQLHGFLRAHAHRILLFLGAAGGLAIAVQAATPMAALALVRRYVADLAATGHALGLITLVASLASLPAAGLLDRWLTPRFGERARPAIMAFGAALAAPCLVLMASAASARVATLALGLFLLITCVANALIPTMLQDLVPAALRARSFAIYSFVIAAFCALGPVLSGLVSDVWVGGDLLLAIAIVGVPALVLALLSAGSAARGSR